MMNCKHIFRHQASIEVEKLIYDIFYCERCLKHVKKERLCPGEIESVKNDWSG